jgi:glycosyltransferase involved in cell wall biosynthesis
MKFSVVVCVKNEENKITQCLKSVKKNSPDEIIVVDGNSKDRTVELAKNFTKKIYITKNSNLPRDRQYGVNKCKNKIIAMIDADHVLKRNDIFKMINEMKKLNFDALQSQLGIYNINSLLNYAENESYNVIHNKVGQKKMIGVAPAVYNAEIFKKVKFDDYITKTIEDADFIYKLRKAEFKFGIGKVKILQNHNPSFRSYLKKFLWYGRGDGEFLRKNPDQIFNVLYHLFFRYNFIYTSKSLFNLKLCAIFFFLIQANVRIFAMLKYLLFFSIFKRK